MGRGEIPRPAKKGMHSGIGNNVCIAGQNRKSFRTFSPARTSTVGHDGRSREAGRWQP